MLFYAQRLVAIDWVSGLMYPIATYLRRNLHVTASGMFIPYYLERTVAIVGTDRLLFSTNYPYTSIAPDAMQGGFWKTAVSPDQIKRRSPTATGCD